MQTRQQEKYELIAPPKPYSALIFDCDGTLVDTMPIHYQAWVKVLTDAGAEFSEKLFYAMAGMPTPQIIRCLNKEYGYQLDVDFTVDAKENLFVELAQQISEVQAVAQIARSHKGVMPMAVASGGLRTVVETMLQRTGLRSLFDVVITAEDVVHGKPHPDMFLLAAERMGVPAADCVVYEDADFGMEAARSAGMRAVDVRVLWQ